MWITGDQQDFAARLHSLPTGTQELITGFQAEGVSYTGSNPTYLNNKWNSEFNHRWAEFTNDAMSTGKWFIS